MSTFAAVERVAKALLYEGYALFPYSSGSLKNRIRASFGELCPRDSIGRSMQSSDVLVDAGEVCSIEARIAFLQPIRRVVKDRDGREVATLDAGDRRYCGWQEAKEIVSVVGPLPWRAIVEGEGHTTVETVPAVLEHLDVGTGSLERIGCALEVVVRLTARPAPQSPPRAFILRCEVVNATRVDDTSELASVHSAHVALYIEGGAFVSAIDPPATHATAAEACESDGAWPVLVGRAPDRSLALLSPIILPDYPKIAEESPDDLFDMTENDELLTLSIASLSDEERRAMAATDPRCAALLARIDERSHHGLDRMHGAIRSMRASTTEGKPRVRVGGAFIGVGDCVRLHPSGRDALDGSIAGKTAKIVDILVDVEGREQAVVVLDDDPGRDLGMTGVGLGHRLFVEMGEIEPIGAGTP